MEKSEIKGRERAFGGPFIIKQESTRSFCPGASAFSSVTLKVRVLKLLRAGWYSRSASLTPALLTPLAVKVWGPHAPTLSLVGKTAFQISAHEALQKQRGHAPQLPPASWSPHLAGQCLLSSPGPTAGAPRHSIYSRPKHFILGYSSENT